MIISKHIFSFHVNRVDCLWYGTHIIWFDSLLLIISSLTLTTMNETVCIIKSYHYIHDLVIEYKHCEQTKVYGL